MADKVRKFTIYRIKNLDRAEQEYYQTLQRTLDKIEDDVVRLAGKELPTQAGKLIELQAAIAIRPKIRTVLQTEFLAWADTLTKKGFNRQAKRIERAFKGIGNIPIAFQELTKGDLALIQNLKLQTFTQFKDISNTFTKQNWKRTEILAASIRNVRDVGRAFEYGANICTLPPTVFNKMYNHILTDK